MSVEVAERGDNAARLRYARSVKRLWWQAGLGLGLLGCAVDDPTIYDRGRLAVCKGACRAFRRCLLTDAGCEARCAANYEPGGIRPSALLRIGPCLEEADCASLDEDTAFASCAKRAALAEPLRDAVIEYCESASKNLFRCDVWWSVEECAHSVGFWEDDVLNAAKGCHGLPCDALQSCERSAFGSGE